MKILKPIACLLLLAAAAAPRPLNGAPAQLLFSDDFERGFPGWTVVLPTATYTGGPLRWQYDIVRTGWVENSNINAVNGMAPLLINDTASGNTFVYRARFVAGDDDGFGLVFGYLDSRNYYRLSFGREQRTTSPYNGWTLEQSVNNVLSPLFGKGSGQTWVGWTNTAGRPFEVAIQVRDATTLTVILVDHPDTVPTAPNPLVLLNGVTLPRSAAGKVGIFSWGMQGNGAARPVAFRATDLHLAPNALAGNPGEGLKDWTSYNITRAGGAYNPDNGGVGAWGLVVGTNGPLGALFDYGNAHSYGSADPVADNSRTDFGGPTIVAGDLTWSNLIVRAKIHQQDDDGFGLVFRFQDSNTFYRLTFCEQAHTAVGAAPYGVSIQKRIGGAWSEVFLDQAGYRPRRGARVEVLLAMIGQRLSFTLVDPDTGQDAWSYGPIDFSGGAGGVEVPLLLSHVGKVGFHHWGSEPIAFEEIEVFNGEGQPFQIRPSPYGTPNPAPGVHTYTDGASVTAQVDAVVPVGPGERQRSNGWRGVGSVPPSGAENQVTFAIQKATLLEWLWQRQYQLTVTASAGGSVAASSGEWVDQGTPVTLTANPAAGYLFSHWQGDSISRKREISTVMSRPRSFHAVFEADSDADGLADAWELTWFGNLGAGAGDDPDQDGWTNAQEYAQGTPPHLAGKILVDPLFASRWENVQRDPILPGRFLIEDFGGGYRGLWENSNDARDATDTRFSPFALYPETSFEGPRLVIRPEHWNPAWTDYTVEALFAVGDTNGVCLYLRYQNESNWCRVTLSGFFGSANDPPYGVSVQTRRQGVYTELFRSYEFAIHPDNFSGYKQVRITAAFQGKNLRVQVAGWMPELTPPVWNEETALSFEVEEPELTFGRVGIGSFSMGTEPTPPHPAIPIDNGLFVGPVRVRSGGAELFYEDWSGLPHHLALPADWLNPWVGNTALDGDWRVTAHGSLVQLTNEGTDNPASAPSPIAEGTMLVSPVLAVDQYLLEVLAQPFDDDGFGLVFNYQNNDNYDRVMFSQQNSGTSVAIRGVTISRKQNGVWTDLALGDSSFIYTPGEPLWITLQSRGGDYHLSVRELSGPGASGTWRWAAPASQVGQRIGVIAWHQEDQHFHTIRVRSLTEPAALPPVEITAIAREGSEVVIEFSNPGGGLFQLEYTDSLAAPSWQPQATGLSGTIWRGPAPAERRFWRTRR